MTERFFQFLPSITVLMSIALVTFVYLRLVSKKFKERMKSIEWCKENHWKIIWLIGVPLQHIWAPVAEELVFRAPLIVLFSSISGNAWRGIWISSILFSLVHYFGKKIALFEVLSAKEKGDTKTDSLEAEISDIQKKESKRVRIRKFLHPVAVFPLGVLSGYYGVKYQSIWTSVGIHFVWNLIMPIIIVLLILIVMSAGAGIKEAWHELKYKWRRRRTDKRYERIR